MWEPVCPSLLLCNLDASFCWKRSRGQDRGCCTCWPPAIFPIPPSTARRCFPRHVCPTAPTSLSSATGGGGGLYTRRLETRPLPHPSSDHRAAWDPGHSFRPSPSFTFASTPRTGRHTRTSVVTLSHGATPQVSTRPLPFTLQLPPARRAPCPPPHTHTFKPGAAPLVTLASGWRGSPSANQEPALRPDPPTLGPIRAHSRSSSKLSLRGFPTQGQLPALPLWDSTFPEASPSFLHAGPTGIATRYPRPSREPTPVMAETPARPACARFLQTEEAHSATLSVLAALGPVQLSRDDSLPQRGKQTPNTFVGLTACRTQGDLLGSGAS